MPYKYDLGYGSLSTKTIDRVHDEVDVLRKCKGLKPWKWKKENIMSREFKSKYCWCSENCKTLFVPTSAAQKYAPGHNTPKPPKPKVDKPKINREEPIINYRIALDTAEKELVALDKEIEDADNEMEGFRAGIASMQMVKDAAVVRHERVVATIEVLKNLLVKE